MKLIRCNNKMNEKLGKGSADHCCLAWPASLYPICVRSDGPPFARPVGRVACWQVSLIVANRTTVYIYSKYWSLRCSHILHNNTTLYWWVHILPNVVSWTFGLLYHPLHTPHVANHILCTLNPLNAKLEFVRHKIITVTFCYSWDHTCNQMKSSFPNFMAYM